SLLMSLPFLALYGFARVADLNVANGAWSFLVGMVFSNILACMLQSPVQRSSLMLALATAYNALPYQSLSQLESLLAGTLVWKCTDSIFGKSDERMEDILPFAIWLCTLIWSTEGVVDSAHSFNQQGLILGTISVGMLLRWLGEFILKHDELYLKRVLLALLGGLSVLLVSSRLLVAAHFDNMAILAGCGFLLAYIFDSIERHSDGPLEPVSSLKNLLLVGIGTLVSTRLFGNLGSLELAATMLLASRSRAAQLAAYFWCGRAIVQSFVTEFNPNVTGINLNHPYTAAGLYAGFLLVIVMALCLRNLEEKKLLCFAILAMMTAAPMASLYFVHAEPTSSILVSATVASLIMSLAVGAFSETARKIPDVIILTPIVMASAALLSNQLLNLGDYATAKERLLVLAAGALILVCIAIMKTFLSGLLLTRGLLEPSTEQEV
ncbi:MAG TPA: hypothetical protein V6C72_19790, partial [Chroococcales cyanobacterium]